jgi:hypothetical protein
VQEAEEEVQVRVRGALRVDSRHVLWRSEP